MSELDIVVGKFTLESLTTGMYSDARIIYREYIQNAVDSLENAIELGLIEKQEMRISIIADNKTQHISMIDNGTGISSTAAPKVLINIGDSTKRSSNNRGFRGIGRLGGMSYCDKLVFKTSSAGEKCATEIVFDCAELKRLLSPGIMESEDLASLLNRITTVSSMPEDKDSHYFLVDLYGVDETTGLLDDENIRTYIEEVAPLPYKKSQFYLCSEIDSYTKDNGYTIEEFPIFFGTSNANLRPLYKLNRVRFKSNRNKRDADEIDNLEFFKIEVDGCVYALGWYANCSWLGTLSNLEMAGIRVRKGNILIGDRTTLNPIFGNQSRFNAWVQGEVFVLHDNLIPNARRDDFEKNEAYNTFLNEMKSKVGQVIITKIRTASLKRNDSVGKTLKQINSTLKETQKELSDGFNSRIDKENALQVLEDAITSLEKLPKNLDEDRTKTRDELIEKVTDLQQEVETNSHYKLEDIEAKLDRRSKKLLQFVSEVLSEKLSKELADIIIDGIKEKIRGK